MCSDHSKFRFGSRLIACRISNKIPLSTSNAPQVLHLHSERAMAAAVAYATSSDPHHPPSAVLDGSPATFWSTTGLFPQELALTWPSERPISKVVIKSCDGE